MILIWARGLFVMIISRNIRISLAYKEGDDDDMNIHWGQKTAIVGFASRCCSHFWERWPVLTWSWETSIGCLKTTQVTCKVMIVIQLWNIVLIVLSLGLTMDSIGSTLLVLGGTGSDKAIGHYCCRIVHQKWRFGRVSQWTYNFER